MTKHLANILTASRILGSISLLFFPAFSAAFYIIYLFCGFSDMIDGAVARKTNSTSALGSRLDTIADIAFVAASFIKLLPKIDLPRWLWIWCAALAVIKIGNIIFGYVYKKQFVSPHTAMNKIAGLLLFLLPLTATFAELQHTVTAVCTAAMFAAIQEGILIRQNDK